MIKAVIFDLNGVFIVSPKLSQRFQADYSISQETFLPALSEIMDKVRRPDALPAFSYWRPYLEAWGIDLDEQQFWDYWFGAEKESPEMIGLASELRRQGITVIVLSNNFKERSEYYAHYPALQTAVDHIYYSWQTGFVKPDPQAWQYVIEHNNLKPDECIYFDDQDKNIRSAESLGIRSHMFVDTNVTRQILVDDGVITRAV